jgi:hypothetical protein
MNRKIFIKSLTISLVGVSLFPINLFGNQNTINVNGLNHKEIIRNVLTSHLSKVEFNCSDFYQNYFPVIRYMEEQKSYRISLFSILYDIIEQTGGFKSSNENLILDCISSCLEEGINGLKFKTIKFIPTDVHAWGRWNPPMAIECLKI